MLKYFYIVSNNNRFLYRSGHNLASVGGSEQMSCRWPSYESLFHWTGQYLVNGLGYFLGLLHGQDCGPGYKKVDHRSPLGNITE